MLTSAGGRSKYITLTVAPPVRLTIPRAKALVQLGCTARRSSDFRGFADPVGAEVSRSGSGSGSGVTATTGGAGAGFGGRGAGFGDTTEAGRGPGVELGAGLGAGASSTLAPSWLDPMLIRGGILGAGTGGEERSTVARGAGRVSTVIEGSGSGSLAGVGIDGITDADGGMGAGAGVVAGAGAGVTVGAGNPSVAGVIRGRSGSALRGRGGVGAELTGAEGIVGRLRGGMGLAGRSSNPVSGFNGAAAIGSRPGSGFPAGPGIADDAGFVAGSFIPESLESRRNRFRICSKSVNAARPLAVSHCGRGGWLQSRPRSAGSLCVGGLPKDQSGERLASSGDLPANGM